MILFVYRVSELQSSTSDFQRLSSSFFFFLLSFFFFFSATLTVNWWSVHNHLLNKNIYPSTLVNFIEWIPGVRKKKSVFVSLNETFHWFKKKKNSRIGTLVNFCTIIKLGILGASAGIIGNLVMIGENCLCGYLLYSHAGNQSERNFNFNWGQSVKRKLKTLLEKISFLTKPLWILRGPRSFLVDPGLDPV